MKKLSVITINYNNAGGLIKTMQSVLDQAFTGFEYIIIDGGSSDDSRNHIERHSQQLAYWVSEPDRGVYHAMNKGIVKASGEYLLFLNSGDFLNSSNSLNIFFEHSNGEDIIYADILKDDGIKQWIKSCPSQLSFSFFLKDALPHQSTIIKKKVFEKTGLYNEDYKIVSDWEVCMNAICLHQVSYKHIHECVAVFKTGGVSSHPQNADLFQKERQAVIDKYYQPFIADYTKASVDRRTLEEYRSAINNVNNSRAYKLLKKISNSPFYKFIKQLST